MRRLVATVFTFTAACLLVVVPYTAAAAGGDEYGVLNSMNAIRQGRGVHALEVHPQLQLKAAAWAAHLADAGALSHSSLAEGITAPWVTLAENVVVADTVEQAQHTLIASPLHLANMVDSRLTHVGVGVVSAGGRVYVAQEFMALAAPSAPATVLPAAPVPVATPPAAPPPAPVTPAPASAPAAPAAVPAAPAPHPAPVLADPAPTPDPGIQAPPAEGVPVATPPAPPAEPVAPAVVAPAITRVTHHPDPATAGTSAAGPAGVAAGLLFLAAASLVRTRAGVRGWEHGL